MTKATKCSLLVGGSVFVGGVVLGIVVGAVSGLLFAPRSGEETRDHLRKHADELGEKIKNKSAGILETGKRKVDTALQHVAATVENTG